MTDEQKTGSKPADAAPAASAGPPVKVEPERLEWLEPKSLAFRWDGGTGPIAMTIADQRTFLRIHAGQAYPQSDERRFIQFFDSRKDGQRGEPVGMLRNLDDLQPEQQKIVQECLKRSYLVPRVLRIVDIHDEYHLVRWTLETDRGPVAFDMDNIYKNIQRRPGGRVVLTDTHENHYEIPDRKKLDRESRAMLDAYL
ncbi:MAG: DUF1854 domain-containing protein [Planctomycetes bacterium]|nr:DUF1854 domain-containing protein [Planctomycetota bacterium]